MSTIENIEELSTTETDDKYKQLPLTQFEQIGIKIGNVGIIAYLISLLLPLLLLPLYPIPWLTVSVPVLDEATNVLLSVKTNIYGFLGFFYLSRNKITWIGVSPILIVSTVISLIMAWHYFQIMKSYRSRDVGYDKIPSTLITLITWLLAIIIPSQYLEEVTTIGFTRKVESWGDAYHFYITGKGTFSVQETHYGLFLSLGCWLVACGFFIAILINYVTEKETRDLYPLISRTSIKFLPGRLGIRIFVVGACFAYVSAWAINLNNPGNPELEPYSISGLGFGIRIFFFEIPENYVTAFQIFLYAGISLLIAGYLFRKERLDEHHEWVNRAFLGSLIGLFIAWMVDGSKIAILGLISISRSMFVNLIDQNTLENTQFSIEYEGSTFIADIMATGGSLGSGPSILYTATLYGTLLLFVSAITEYFWWTVDKDLIITGELPNSIISVHHLIKFFEIRGGVLNRLAGYVHAVNNVTLEVPRGKTLGIVGESGCGKTTLGKTIIRLYEPTSGEMYYNGMDIASINLRQFHKYRRRMQMVFQDPYASMNPRVMIKDLLAEPIRAHKILPREKVIPYIVRILREVGLDKEHLTRFPHEFSGGQRQRICIARALVLNPKVIVLDEPTASVDVSVQAKVLNLLKRLQESRDLTYIYISHDLSTVTHMSDTVAVMYVGKIVEIGPKTIFTMEEAKIHPYTAALGSAIPIPDPTREKKRIILRGDVPNPVNPPPGCVFHTRCLIAEKICSESEPELKEIEEDHYVACHFR